MNTRFVVAYIVLVLVGLTDAAYLSALHFYQTDPGCSLISGCDTVLGSEWSVAGGIPLAYGGMVYYAVLLAGALVYYQYEHKKALHLVLGINMLGFLVSLWLVYIQAFVLNAFCQYCLLSAVITTAAFVTGLAGLRKGPSGDDDD